MHCYLQDSEYPRPIIMSITELRTLLTHDWPMPTCNICGTPLVMGDEVDLLWPVYGYHNRCYYCWSAHGTA